MTEPTASRSNSITTAPAHGTACPPRRPYVAGDVRRRGQACRRARQNLTAFGDALPTPALRASVDNAGRFTVIVDA